MVIDGISYLSNQLSHLETVPRGVARSTATQPRVARSTATLPIVVRNTATQPRRAVEGGNSC
jgi:hypothetical protein